MVRAVITWSVMLWLLLAGGAASAALDVRVDRNPVGLDETFTLVLESDRKVDDPDFSVLEADFEVLSRNQSSSFQMVNGQSSLSIRWQLTLMAKRAGQLTIPPLQVGGERSTPLTLVVREQAQVQAAGREEALFVEVEAEPREAYVQQQILFTVRLFHAADLASGSTLSAPKVEGVDAVIEPLGEDRSYRVRLNGRVYGVVERRYAIFAQQSGELRIAPLLFNGRVVDAAGRRGGLFPFDPFNPATRVVRVRSEAVALPILPAPANIGGSSWLPSTHLQLVEHWSVEPPNFKVGEPITRTVALMADGLTSAQLPALLGGATDGLKSYPDQPLLEDRQIGDGITGVRQEKVALVPNRPGALTLPAIEVHWWNVAEQRVEVARLPERTVEVAAAPGGVVSPELSAPAQVEDTSAAPLPAVSQAETDGVTMVAEGGAWWWPWLSGVLAVGWLLTLVAWHISRRRDGGRPQDAPSVAGSLDKVKRQLKAACRDNDPMRAKQALLEWARLRWPGDSPRSLTAMAARVPVQLGEVLLALDQVLYASNNGPWDGSALLGRLDDLGRPRQVKAESQAEALQPLIPS